MKSFLETYGKRVGRASMFVLILSAMFGISAISFVAAWVAVIDSAMCYYHGVTTEWHSSGCRGCNGRCGR